MFLRVYRHLTLWFTLHRYTINSYESLEKLNLVPTYLNNTITRILFVSEEPRVI